MHWYYRDVRSRLSHRDFVFVAKEAGLGQPSRNAAVFRLVRDPGYRDRALDSMSLFHALLDSQSLLPVSEGLYFYVLLRRLLLRAGETDRDVADYLAALLVDRPNRHPGGEPLVPYAVDALLALEQARHEDSFTRMAQLADRLLLVTGIFREHLEHRRHRRGAPAIGYYEAVGGQSYQRASRHRLAGEFALDRIYGRLGDGFGEMRSILNDLSDRLISVGEGYPPPQLLN